jgi:hypothetical protein
VGDMHQAVQVPHPMRLGEWQGPMPLAMRLDRMQRLAIMMALLAPQVYVSQVPGDRAPMMTSKEVCPVFEFSLEMIAWSGNAMMGKNKGSNGKTSIIHYRTLSFFAIRFKKKRKFAFFRDFKYKILSFNINQFASLPSFDFLQ